MKTKILFSTLFCLFNVNTSLLYAGQGPSRQTKLDIEEEVLKKNQIVNLHSKHIGDSAIQELVQYDLSHVTTLKLNNNDISDQGAVLLSQGQFKNLTKLYLQGNDISAYGTIHIAQKFINLTSLNISGKIKDDGASAIAQYLVHLTILKLRGNDITDDGVNLIGKKLTRLVELDLGQNLIGDRGAQSIENLRNLKKLNLNRITGKEYKYDEKDSIFEDRISFKGTIAIAKSLSNLEWLDLGGNLVGPQGVIAIIEYLKNLKWLGLKSCWVTNSEVFHIARGLPNLETLDINDGNYKTKIETVTVYESGGGRDYDYDAPGD